MSTANMQEFDDQTLVRYLLGALPEKEAERLDELSITDESFVWRLRAAEDDLVDAYVGGGLSAEEAAQFRKSYLSSPKRLQKVQFAEALRSFGGKTARVRAPASDAPSTESFAPAGERLTRKPSRPWSFAAQSAPLWGFAAVAALLLLVSGYLFQQNVRLRSQALEAQRFQQAPSSREQELQQQLNQQRSANDVLAKEMASLRQAQPKVEPLKTAAALLLPPTRGAGQISTVSVPSGTDLVVLLLTLEADDFPAYRVALKDSVAHETIWQSPGLKSATSGDNKTVSVSFPAHLLNQQNYILELSGLPPNGKAEIITGYPIRVVNR